MRVIQDMTDAGLVPTYREIKDRLGYGSTNVVYNIVTTIVEKRYLSRNPHDGVITILRRLEEETAGEPKSQDPLVLFIHRYQIEHDGASPSFRAISQGMDIRSFSMLRRKMAALVDAGDIEIMSYGNRGQRAGALHVVKKHEVAA